MNHEANARGKHEPHETRNPTTDAHAIIVAERPSFLPRMIPAFLMDTSTIEIAALFRK
ncbi:MAG TPA: hypothetical protein PKW66_14295 [Polyangiaceae bacterium]|nr:hypothetical protein [Polyangiaceae bacterium]